LPLSFGSVGRLAGQGCVSDAGIGAGGSCGVKVSAFRGGGPDAHAEIANAASKQISRLGAVELRIEGDALPPEQGVECIA
jgi:hypothetical protein